MGPIPEILKNEILRCCLDIKCMDLFIDITKDGATLTYPVRDFLKQPFKIEMLKYFKVKFDEVPNCCSNFGHTKKYVYSRIHIYDEEGCWWFQVGHRVHRHAYGLKIKTLNDLIINIIQSEIEIRWRDD